MIGPVRLLRRQLRPHGISLVLLALALALLAAAAVALPRQLATVADAQYAEVFAPDAVPAAEVVLSTRIGGYSPEDRILREVKSALTQFAVLGPAELEPMLADPGALITFDPIDVDSAPDDAPIRIGFGATEALGDWVEVSDGTLPVAREDGVTEVALDTRVAEALGLTTGQSLQTGIGEVRVSGLVAPKDAEANVWRHTGLLSTPSQERLGGATVVRSGAAWVAPEVLPDLSGLSELATATAWYAIRPPVVRADEMPDLARTLRSAAAQGAFLPSGLPLNVTSRTATALSQVAQRQAQTTALVALFASAPLGAMTAAVGVALGAFASRRATARRLLRARGAGMRRLALAGAAEAALAAVPGVLAGGVAALLLVRGGAVLPGVVAMLVIVAATAAAGGLLAATGVRVNRPHPAFRLVAEIVLVLGAGAAAGLLWQGDFVGGSGGVDPLLALAPLLCAAAVAVAVVRVLPGIAALAARLGRRRAGVVQAVGLAGTRRTTASGVAAAMSVVIAACAVASSLVVQSELEDGTRVAARIAVGADLRADRAGDAEATLLAGLPETQAVAVERVAGVALTENGRSRVATILAADADALAAVRPDLPRLDADTMLVSDDLAVSARAGLEVGEWTPASTEVVETDALPTGDEPWVLIDASVLSSVPDARADPLWVLADSADPEAAAAALTEVEATTVAREQTSLTSRPPFVLLTLVLLVGVGTCALVAVLAVVLHVIAGAPERRRTRAVLRLLGRARGGAAGILLWEIVPLLAVATAGGTLLGVVVGIVVPAVIDLAAVLGAVPGAAPPIPGILLGAVAAVVALTGAALVAAASGSRRSVSQSLPNGEA